MIQHLTRAILVMGMLATPAVAQSGEAHLPSLPSSAVSEDGLHIEPWFKSSFLDLREDLTEAQASGKRLMIVWEQKGCPYCKKLHDVNLRIPRVADAVRRDFEPIQLNLWGSREVTDFDGEVLQERDLAAKWGIMFTPTLQFFPATLQEVGDKPGDKAEVVRIPGYFKPFHFYFLLRYAKTGAYAQQPSFQRWLGSIGEALDEKGVHYDIYADALPAALPGDL
ncbi:MAG: thioredoxin fold domain-containing protein [Alphaproteobacteria bacterium]|nr:thioredoxin fold domain-containing protein [Alphaproteobacteria bacterium]